MERVQQELHGHRGRKGDPLYTARRTLHTGADLLTERQHERLDKLFASEKHEQVELTWGAYQRLIAAYRDPDRAAGRAEARSVIDALTDGVPAPLVELRKLGRILSKRAEDVLGLLRAAPHQQRTHRGRERAPRAPARPRPRLPLPHQLHRASTPGGRRIPTPTTPWIVKGRIVKSLIKRRRPGRGAPRGAAELGPAGGDRRRCPRRHHHR
ncbi:hypothetical protein KILIM_018_00810 [Kineosphaera limosa NBRC 100340]|uniref:Transposase IS204/IS1001/IS1096/IS1165 DDE domain-containing protein n=1 Tax=Kineosphaera limosa NBRC 100340 TaxID=1184609 RepID=K6WNG5_9MICO|nr:hypothetical protein KILIM_018_00810 [Kineosphaera limosa NBRC 100340]